MVLGPFRINKSQNYSHNDFVRELFTLLGYFPKIYFFQLHIYRKRHRIRISYSKYQFIIHNTPQTPKHFLNTFFKSRELPNFSNCYFIIGINYIIHNLYILYICGSLVILYIYYMFGSLVILYIFIFCICWGPHSLTSLYIMHSIQFPN